MAEIHINLSEIEHAISRLRTLQAKCRSENMLPPTTIGGGKTVNELENIAEVYQQICAGFDLLISNTIAYLSHVKTSYEESDQKSRNAIYHDANG